MEKQEFIEEMAKYDLKLNVEQTEQFFKYMDLLLEWNEKMNLTAITEPKEVILKHFVDSLTISKYIDENSKVIDVGTGAGFPGIPLKIAKPFTDITLLDSLNKRLNFLNEVINQLNLKKIQTQHYRVEEAGQNKQFREMFDIATSRAVANLRVLSEYMLPLVKVGGKCIAMKGSEIEQELEESEKAISILGGKIESVEKLVLPGTDMNRNIVIIEKIKPTPQKYPRKPGTPSKEPIG